jgi:serine protease
VGDPQLRRRSPRPALCLAAGWLAALTLLSAGEARAKDPGESCRLTQLAAASKLYQTSLSCWAKAYRSPSFDPFACLVKPEAKFRKTYAAAANKAQKAGSHCGLQLRVDALLSLAAGDVDPLSAAIGGDVNLDDKVDRRLRAKLVLAAASFAGKAFAAELHYAKLADSARHSSELASARDKLNKAFASSTAAGMKHGVSYQGLAASDTGDALAAAAEFWARLTRADRGSFQLGGTIAAAESTFVDSDVNDTSTQPVFNGSFFAAQALPVPATVGGYVNRPGAGPQGNSHDVGDPFDTYRVSLRAGQVVTLVMGDDPSTADLDLCLYGPSVESGLCSEGTGSVEIVVAPQDGDYFIDVFPFETCQCGSTYTLSIGQTVPAAALRAPRTDVDFVPGELIVRLRDSSAAASPEAGIARPPKPKSQLPKELGLLPVAGDVSREMLVRLPTASAARAASFEALGAGAARAKLADSSLPPDALARRETVLALKALAKRPEVASVELNTIQRPAAVPSDPLYTLQWHYPLVHLPEAWEIETGSPSVVVAVVDTGVRLDHPDLVTKLVPGYDFISDSARARDGNGIDPDPNDPGDLGGGIGASSFHGTHVAGTIAAATNNGVGVAGIAWGSKVMPVRVLGQRGGTLYDVMQGVRYAAALPNDSGTVPAKPADIINLSLTGGGFSQSEQDLFDAVHDAGVIVVAAAGNSASSAPEFPASYANVFSVAAVDLNRNPAPYSNFGPKIDLAAPGGDTSVDRNADSWADGVLSTVADDSGSSVQFSYAFYQGTSMAAPHVSGIFALMRSVNAAITPDQIQSLLTAGDLTEDLLAPGRDDRTGWGLIDAHAAVIAAGAPAGTPGAALSVSPTGLNFGLAVGAIELTVSNTGSTPLSVTSIADDSGGWLSVTPVAVDGAGLGSYSVSVDRSGLATGSHAATITITSSAGIKHIPVVLRIGGPSASDAGYQYVLLIDAETLVPIDEIQVTAVNGEYTFAFENVPGGDYALIAGTDLDDDRSICDGGEACGSYPTLDLPEPLTLDHDISNADFTTGFQQSIRTGASSVSARFAPGVQRPGR